MIGFTLLSLAGFAPWVFGGRWFYRYTGELGLYGACALVFIGLSGPLLHRLIIGPGSLSRFYGLFSLAFVSYSIVWTVGWMTLRGALGGIVGALAGMAILGVILACGFKAYGTMLKVIVALFLANVTGYFVGEWVHNGVLALKEGNALGLVLETRTRGMLSKTAWGLFYGLGFGAALGFTFYACQAEVRKMLQN